MDNGNGTYSVFLSHSRIYIYIYIYIYIQLNLDNSKCRGPQEFFELSVVRIFEIGSFRICSDIFIQCHCMTIIATSSRHFGLVMGTKH